MGLNKLLGVKIEVFQSLVEKKLIVKTFSGDHNEKISTVSHNLATF